MDQGFPQNPMNWKPRILQNLGSTSTFRPRRSLPSCRPIGRLFLRDAEALTVPVRNLYVIWRAVDIGLAFPSLCHFLEDCTERKDIRICEQSVLSKPTNKFF